MILKSKFRNKYRIKSTRLKHYDYSTDGAYYVTICTLNRINYFGNIINSEMQLSKIGEMAKFYWEEIPKYYPYVTLDKFIIMPNHIHGIIIINKPVSKINPATFNIETPRLGVSTIKKNFHWNKNCLGAIINQYKRICTINIKKINRNFSWQSRYYEHIIRSEDDLERVEGYIINNPNSWENDCNNIQ